MRIAILGWGSLVYAPGELRYEGDWQRGGPTLPIEFSRVSSRSRLTLVIDDVHGKPVTARYARSSHDRLEEAIRNLAKRERAVNESDIGFVEVDTGRHRCRVAGAGDTILAWVKDHGFDAAVWTDLGPTLHPAVGSSLEDVALAQLRAWIEAGQASEARDYIERAPEEVDTPVRRAARSLGWGTEGGAENPECM